MFAVPSAGSPLVASCATDDGSDKK